MVTSPVTYLSTAPFKRNSDLRILACQNSLWQRCLFFLCVGGIFWYTAPWRTFFRISKRDDDLIPRGRSIRRLSNPQREMTRYNTWIATMISKFKRKALLEKIITYNTLQEKSIWWPCHSIKHVTCHSSMRERSVFRSVWKKPSALPTWNWKLKILCHAAITIPCSVWLELRIHLFFRSRKKCSKKIPEIQMFPGT